MNHKWVMSIACSTLLACAGPQAAGEKGGVTKEESQRITNISYFDLATCNPQPQAIQGAPNAEAVTGLLIAAQPVVLECLVDPAHRGAEENTTVSVASTLAAAGAEHQITGENLTADGEHCIRTALDRWFAAVPGMDLSALSEPASGQAQFQHVVNHSPSVEFGKNEASDMVGTIRLAQAGWCDCYQPWQSQAPRSLRADLRIVKPTKTLEGEEAPRVTTVAEEVTLKEVEDPTAQEVGRCLQAKLGQVEFRPLSGQLAIPYPLIHLNSNVSELLPEAPPDLQFTQFDLLRARKAANTVVTIGARQEVFRIYDGAVQTYLASKRKSIKAARDLPAKCKLLVEADEAVIAALGEQKAQDEASLAFVTALEDPQWAQVQTVLEGKVTEVEEEIGRWRDVRDGDQGSCPKVKW